MVVADQVVDRTTGRNDTFYDGPITTHVSFADPYCPQLRPVAVGALQIARHHDARDGHDRRDPRPALLHAGGIEVVPRRGLGSDQHDPVSRIYLARELEICYVNISLITDYDVGSKARIEPVTHEEVLKVFASNNDRVKQAIFKIVEGMPAERTCGCGSALSSSARRRSSSSSTPCRPRRSAGFPEERRCK
jgi:5'-methylthioadenosine phosphorylase